MLTDDELRIGYMRKFNKVLTHGNLLALKDFIRNFEIEHYTNFDEMYDALNISMRTVSEDLERCENTEEAYKILKKRYSKL